MILLLDALREAKRDPRGVQSGFLRLPIEFRPHGREGEFEKERRTPPVERPADFGLGIAYPHAEVEAPLCSDRLGDVEDRACMAKQLQLGSHNSWLGMLIRRNTMVSR